VTLCSIPGSASQLVFLVASHSPSPSPSLVPSLSPSPSLFLSLCPGLGPGSVPAPGLCLGIARGFSAGCRGEMTTWSSSAGTGVLVRYQEPDISETNKTCSTLCKCLCGEVTTLYHTIRATQITARLFMHLWQHQTKHEEHVMVISDYFLQKL